MSTGEVSNENARGWEEAIHHFEEEDEEAASDYVVVLDDGEDEVGGCGTSSTGRRRTTYRRVREAEIGPEYEDPYEGGSECRLTAELEDEGLNAEEDATVIIAQVGGRDHHIETLPSAPSTVSDGGSSSSREDPAKVAARSRKLAKPSLRPIRGEDHDLAGGRAQRTNHVVRRFTLRRAGGVEASAIDAGAEEGHFEQRHHGGRASTDQTSPRAHEGTRADSFLPFRCQLCEKGFRSQKLLRGHEKTHVRAKCDVCQKVFRRPEDLTLHRKVHIEGAIFKCPDCIRIFFDVAELAEHEQQSHGQRKKSRVATGGGRTPASATTTTYKCQHCDKTFSKIPHLVNHERIHSGMRPFPCRYCGKTFVQATNAARHERIHTGEKRFACDFCDRRFSLKAHKKSHERVHAPAGPHERGDRARTYRRTSHFQLHRAPHGGSQAARPYDRRKCFERKASAEAHETDDRGRKPCKSHREVHEAGR